VRDRRTFAALRKDGRRHRSGPVTATVLHDPDASGARVAFAVTRNLGGAVQRNRLRRQLRAIVRDVELAPGAYLLSVAPAAARLSFDELAAHVTKACDA
jgi:ribonuclease P protein component